MDICTIIAKNYVAFARVLARSHREHHPGARCFVLVIDETDGHLDPEQEPFELITPSQLDLDGFERMAARYDVLELSTAVKPWLLRHLLHERGLEKVAYLDPDIQVCSSLQEIDALLDTHEVVLIPHLTEPIPDDGFKPSEADILIAGAYNLGFIGLARRPAANTLLDWWSERLATECVVAPERGVFVDQRWMDLVHGFVPHVAVLRDPGYDVAYWNLHSRPLQLRDGQLLAGGSPLRFMHFSGFDPLDPARLSKHQNRIQLVPGEPLAELCEQYAQRVLAEGHRQAREWPYTYGALPDGTALDRFVRAAYALAEEQEAVRNSIFTGPGAGELLDWLTSPAEQGGSQGVNRYLAVLHETYPGLAHTFGELSGRGASELVAWARVYGRSEVPIPDALLPGFGAGRAGSVHGVNVAGYFDAVLGVGEAARQMIGALESQRIEVATVGLSASAPRDPALARRVGGGRAGEPGPAGERGDGSPVPAAGEPRFATNLICVNADMLSAFAQQMGPSFFAGRYSALYCFWEVECFPERWLGAFKHVNELWVGSSFMAKTLAEVSPVPVVCIPTPVALNEPPLRTRAQLGLPEGFLFLFVFDYASVFARKNPLAVVEAFERAFGEHDDAVLVLKCINSERDPSNHERLLAAAARRRDMHVIDRTVSAAERDAMVAACDCYVSLHRSEGFGFTLAEAMWFGKPVIATGYSGNLDYMRPDNSYLVDHELVPVGLGADPYPPDCRWAQPDVDHAARLMREVFEHPAAAQERASRGAEQLRASHSPEAVGRAIARRLAHVDRSSVRSGAGASALVHGELAHTSRRIRSGPAPTGRVRFGRAQRFARRLVLRLIKPFTVHERIVDEELVRAIAAVGDGLAGAHIRIDELSRRVQDARPLEPLGDARGLAVEEPQAQGEDDGGEADGDEQAHGAAYVDGGAVN